MYIVLCIKLYKENLIIDIIDFIVSIPNTGIDETRILQGKMGEYIVSARRIGIDWYIGGMTNWESREVILDLSFLGSGEYMATIFKDGANAAKQATDYKKEEQVVTLQTRLKLLMAPGGGIAISLKKR